MSEGMFPSQRLVSSVGEYQTRAPAVVEEFGKLFPGNIPIHPVPFFGPLETARILTVALNPSSTEFVPWRCWPETFSPECLTRRLFNYFKLTYPRPHAWFAELQEAVSLLNCSYESNVAHIDVSPWGTFSPTYFRKNMPGEMLKYKGLLEEEVAGLSTLVKFSKDLKLVIILCGGQEANRATKIIRSAFGGSVEFQGKGNLSSWIWNKRQQLSSLVGTQPINC